MAGEIIKSEGVCLDIRPWSKTSHVVSWMTGAGRVATVVKGAVRPKSAFLGQYDLNYTCEILYYARARGEVHALRECVPVERRDELRGDFRALALAGYFRRIVAELAPVGPDAVEWFGLLDRSLTELASDIRDSSSATVCRLYSRLVAFELKALDFMGLKPEIAAEGGELQLRGERRIPISAATAACLRNPRGEKNESPLIDAARVIGVYYHFHVDCASDVRRTVLGLISKPKQEREET